MEFTLWLCFASLWEDSERKTGFNLRPSLSNEISGLVLPEKLRDMKVLVTWEESFKTMQNRKCTPDNLSPAWKDVHKDLLERQLSLGSDVEQQQMPSTVGIHWLDKGEQSMGSLQNAGSDEWSSTEKHLTIEGKKGSVFSSSAKMIPGEELSKFSCALCFAPRNALSKCAFHPRAASESVRQSSL